MREHLRRLLYDESGTALTEYALLATVLIPSLAGVPALLRREFTRYAFEASEWTALPVP